MNVLYSTTNAFLKRSLFKLSFTFLLFTSFLSSAQTQLSVSEDQLLWSKENFANYDQHKEILGQRDAHSKHFLNVDGTITALLAAGDFHYWEDNQWKTIFHSIVKAQNGFENLTNSFKTSFPEFSTGNIITRLPNNAGVIRDMINMKMYYEVNGNPVQVQNIQSKIGSTNFNELTYSGVYGEGIDLRLTQETKMRKMDYIINNLEALGSIPSNAIFLIFEESVNLPSGWLAKLEGNEIKILNASGQLMAVYKKPKFRDTAEHFDNEEGQHIHKGNELEGIYELTQNGTDVIIKTKVSLEWLLGSEINFPVYIDPTINCSPNNTNFWTGYVRTDSGNTCVTEGCANYTSTAIDDSGGDDIYMGRQVEDEVWNSWARFNISSLSQNICINAVDLNYNIYDNYSGTPGSGCNITAYIRHMANDPVPATNADRLTDIRNGDVYSATNFSTPGGWVVKPLTANLNHLLSAIPSGWFALGLHSAAGGAHTTCRQIVRGRSHADRPYLTVNYTPLFLANFVSQSSSCSDWLPGETRNVSITVQNTGCTAWTSGGGGNNVNFSWWGSWQGGQDSNPRILPYSNLTQGNSQVITFSVTAPMAAGSYTIFADNVRDGFCWFRDNNGVCGPGNTSFSFNINVTPAANSTTAQVCVGETTSVALTLPTGGTITTVGSDRVHTFTSNGNFVTTYPISNARILVVGGGGAGGRSEGNSNNRAGGGGGGGGVLNLTGQTIGVGTLPAVIGNGGNGSAGSANDANEIATARNGQQSSFNGNIAYGGGGGGNGESGHGAGQANAPTLASGGGHGRNRSHANNTGLAGQGTKGGDGGTGGGNTRRGAGGGGGAGGAGSNGGAGSDGILGIGVTNGNGGNGGVGLSSDITGAAVFYGGGGGGSYGRTDGNQGSGGNGGGGNGVRNTNGGNGTANTGGGGGGAATSDGTLRNGGNGGSGIVIVRYSLPTYSSDNPAVATVNASGLVTGVSPGVANITVSSGSYCQNVQVTVGTSSTAPTSITGGGTICQGNAPTLTSTGGVNGASAMNVWYTGGCNNAYTHTWSNQPFGLVNTTVNSTTGGILNVTSTSNDPMIDMPLLGSFNPTVYRYINVRYRVTAGTAGAMEVFFHNAHYTYAHGDHHTWSPLISDNQWHIATLDLTQNAHFLADASNITGWRYDWATNSGVTMELDFIQLSQYPMIDENSTDAILVLTPGSSYYPAPGTTVTYASARIDCAATGCQSTTVTLPAQSAILATNGQQATCTVNANETVSFFHVGSGNYIATVTAGATGLGSVTATVYDDGAPLAVPACGDPSPQYITSVMERHWVITPTTNGSANVWLPYYNTELASLTTAANANANLEDDVAGQGSVLLSKYSGGAWPASVNVDSNPFNNCAPPVSTGVGGTILIGNNAFGTVQSYLATFPATTLYSRYPITGFSEFWLHGAVDSPLPIILSDFSASCDEQTKISWSTSSEVNSDYFVVEKSRDGLHWDEVETVAGKGLSTTLSSYQVIDEQAFELIYYRLKQVDIDNNTTYFGPISVDCNAKNKLAVYPNPSNGDFTIEIVTKSLMKDVQVVLYDISGKVISSKKIDLINGTHLYTIDATGLEKGTYIVGIAGENKNEFVPIKVVLY